MLFLDIKMKTLKVVSLVFCLQLFSIGSAEQGTSIGMFWTVLKVGTYRFCGKDG
jgi:hypothetical protein